MVTETRAESETLEQFDRRHAPHPAPALGTPEETIKGRAKARRSIDSITSITSREETETGRALASWWVALVDVWVACDALPPDQREVMRLYFLTEHHCEGSGSFVGKEFKGKSVVCSRCLEYNPATHQREGQAVGVNARGELVEHNRQYGNEDVARELSRSARWVQDQKRAAIETIKGSVWPWGLPEHE